jgi:predicted Ser/Thr protein kinase
MRPPWQRVRELLERALEERPADLAAWLLRECPDDGDVRAEVKLLYEQLMRAGDFLAEPIAVRVPSLLNELQDDEPGYLPGDVIGQYTIARELGRGGMGRVYLATAADLHRKVALKVLPPAMARDPLQRDRLKRGARAAALLNHSGICTVYALEEHEGELFMSAEYIDGHTLRDELAKGRRPSAEDVLRTAQEIAAALACAHASGVIHRDLKPENLMRTGDGRLKIVDFGLARVEGAAAAALMASGTESGVILGTPAYMAPEQLEGKRVDARTDVFAFGVLLYEYACGVHPFAAATCALVMARILKGNAVRLEERCPQLPRHLTAIIDRCLMNAPHDRFPSAADIAAALSESAAVEVKPVPVRRWWRMHQAIGIGLYFLASVTSWINKEWYDAIAAVATFAVIGIAATVGGVFRGHLLFIERMNHPELAPELRRSLRVTLIVDLLIAAALSVDAALLLITTEQKVVAVLSVALAVGIALARIVVEPSTTKAAFPDLGPGLEPRAPRFTAAQVR